MRQILLLPLIATNLAPGRLPRQDRSLARNQEVLAATGRCSRSGLRAISFVRLVFEFSRRFLERLEACQPHGVNSLLLNETLESLAHSFRGDQSFELRSSRYFVVLACAG